jgi:hypothetical protein
MTFEERERALRQRLEAFPPAARAEFLHVLPLPDSTLPTGSASCLGLPRESHLRRAPDRLRGGPNA